MTGRRTKVVWVRYEGGPLDGHREIRHTAIHGQRLLACTPVGNPATTEAVHEYAVTDREWRTPPGVFPRDSATVAVFVRTIGARSLTPDPPIQSASTFREVGGPRPTAHGERSSGSAP